MSSLPSFCSSETSDTDEEPSTQLPFWNATPPPSPVEQYCFAKSATMGIPPFPTGTLEPSPLPFLKPLNPMYDPTWIPQFVCGASEFQSNPFLFLPSHPQD